MSGEWRRGGYLISTDSARIDIDVVHRFLVGSYWAEGIPREAVGRSVRHSLCFGLYDGARQNGLARVITARG